ncbi:MAG: hypothetical protein ACRDZ1_07125 [Acidimicrobiia bacterium]
MSALGRRAFLQRLLALVTGGGLWPRTGPTLRRDSDPWPALGEALAQVLTDPGATRRVGRRYLDAEPTEASVPRLLALLPTGGTTADARAAEREIARHPRAFLARVGKAARADFAEGETVVVDGWQLSRAEARLAALTALTSEPPA